MPSLGIFFEKEYSGSEAALLYCQLKESSQSGIQKEELLLAFRVCSQGRSRGICHVPTLSPALSTFSYREEISTNDEDERSSVSPFPVCPHFLFVGEEE